MYTRAFLCGDLHIKDRAMPFESLEQALRTFIHCLHGAAVHEKREAKTTPRSFKPSKKIAKLMLASGLVQVFHEYLQGGVCFGVSVKRDAPWPDSLEAQIASGLTLLSPKATTA